MKVDLDKYKIVSKIFVGTNLTGASVPQDYWRLPNQPNCIGV
jgi:hypothetical protein